MSGKKLKADEIKSMWVFLIDGEMVHHCFREEDVAPGTEAVLNQLCLHELGIKQEQVNRIVKRLRKKLVVEKREVKASAKGKKKVKGVPEKSDISEKSKEVSEKAASEKSEPSPLAPKDQPEKTPALPLPSPTSKPDSKDSESDSDAD